MLITRPFEVISGIHISAQPCKLLSVALLEAGTNVSPGPLQGHLAMQNEGRGRDVMEQCKLSTVRKNYNLSRVEKQETKLMQSLLPSHLM